VILSVTCKNLARQALYLSTRGKTRNKNQNRWITQPMGSGSAPSVSLNIKSSSRSPMPAFVSSPDATIALPRFRSPMRAHSSRPFDPTYPASPIQNRAMSCSANFSLLLMQFKHCLGVAEDRSLPGARPILYVSTMQNGLPLVHRMHLSNLISKQSNVEKVGQKLRSHR
jgi:hypothetical protein